MFLRYLKRGSFFIPPDVNNVFETASEMMILKRLRGEQSFDKVVPFKVSDTGALKKWWSSDEKHDNFVWLLVRKVGAYAGRHIYYIRGKNDVLYYGAGEVKEFKDDCCENPWFEKNGHIVCDWDPPSNYKGSNPKGANDKPKRQGTGFLKITCNKESFPLLSTEKFVNLSKSLEAFVMNNHLNCGNPKSITASIVERFFCDTDFDFNK